MTGVTCDTAHRQLWHWVSNWNSRALATVPPITCPWHPCTEPWPPGSDAALMMATRLVAASDPTHTHQQVGCSSSHDYGFGGHDHLLHPRQLSSWSTLLHTKKFRHMHSRWVPCHSLTFATICPPLCCEFQMGLISSWYLVRWIKIPCCLTWACVYFLRYSLSLSKRSFRSITLERPRSAISSWSFHCDLSWSSLTSFTVAKCSLRSDSWWDIEWANCIQSSSFFMASSDDACAWAECSASKSFVNLFKATWSLSGNFRCVNFESDRMHTVGTYRNSWIIEVPSAAPIVLSGNPQCISQFPGGWQ